MLPRASTLLILGAALTCGCGGRLGGHRPGPIVRADASCYSVSATKSSPLLPALAASDVSPPATPLVSRLELNRDASLTLEQALSFAMRNSDVVRVVSGSQVVSDSATAWDVDASQAQIQAALAAFDWNFAASAYGTRIKQPPNAFFGPGLNQPNQRSEGAFNARLGKRLMTGGEAQVSFDPNPGYLFIGGGNGSSFNPTHVGELEFLVKQPVLRGAGLAVNRAPIQIARMKTEQSAWEFKKAVLASVRSTLVAYYDLHAARVALSSVNKILPLAEEVARLQEAAYRTQWVIYADVAKAYAQVHRFRRERLALQEAVAERELQLRNLMGLPPADGYNLVPVSTLQEAYLAPDGRAAMELALQYHPDLVRQRLNCRIREVELNVAQNAYRPQLDFEAIYRMNGVGESLGDALQQMSSAAYSDYRVGATFETPLGRRAGAANVKAAERKLTRETRLLDQALLNVSFVLGGHLQRLHYEYLQYDESRRQRQAAEAWLHGAQLRYRSPIPVGETRNWLLQSLNDYLQALEFANQSAATEAEALASYNSELIRLDESTGVLLGVCQIQLLGDPTNSAAELPPPAKVPTPPTSPTPPGPTPPSPAPRGS